LRFGDKNVRGYEATDLGDAWSRYLPAADDEDKEDVTSSIPPGDIREEGDDRSPSLSPRDATSATAATERPCDVCGTRLSPWLIERGETTHPNCDPDGLVW
jgi:hypothetical protein